MGSAGGAEHRTMLPQTVELRDYDGFRTSGSIEMQTRIAPILSAFWRDFCPNPCLASHPQNPSVHQLTLTLTS